MTAEVVSAKMPAGYLAERMELRMTPFLIEHGCKS